MELINRNVVVTAQNFNPSIFTQLWLVRNDIVAAEEFRDDCLFSSDACQINAATFDILVIKPMLQLSPREDGDRENALVHERIGRIANALPHTPFTAVGLNFTWHETPTGETIEEMTRRLFARQNDTRFLDLVTPDAQFGYYVSKDFHGHTRLKLDIKPVAAQSDAAEKRLQFAFNFHREINRDNPLEDIGAATQLWGIAKESSRAIVQKILGLEEKK